MSPAAHSLFAQALLEFSLSVWVLERNIALMAHTLAF